MTLALRSFEHPAAERTIVWDLRHAGHMLRLLEELPRFPYRQAAHELLEHLAPRIEAQLPYLRHQIVHNDLNPLDVWWTPQTRTA